MADGFNFKCLIFLTVLLTPLASAHRPLKQADKITDVSKLGGKKCGPGVNIPGIGVNIPGVDVNVPGVHVDVPGFDVNVPGVGVEVPGFNIPGVRVPGVNIPGGQIANPYGGGVEVMPEITSGCVPYWPYGGSPPEGLPMCGWGAAAGSAPGTPGLGWRQNQVEIKRKKGPDHKLPH